MNRPESHAVRRANNGMNLTKLSAAWMPAWTCRLMAARARLDADTASQPIPGGRTRGMPADYLERGGP